MTHVTMTILNEAVQAMPNAFDSHRLIREIMKRHPREYVRELAEHLGGDDPIQQGHAEIGRALLSVPLIRPTRKVLSPNIRGEDSENQEWAKV